MYAGGITVCLYLTVLTFQGIRLWYVCPTPRLGGEGGAEDLLAEALGAFMFFPSQWVGGCAERALDLVLFLGAGV